MAKTLRELLVSALTERGETVEKHLSRCVVMTRKRTLFGDKPVTNESHWYVGVNGSLRYGQTRGGSVAVDEILKKRLLVESGRVDVEV